jgi:hypothetical protein
MKTTNFEIGHTRRPPGNRDKGSVAKLKIKFNINCPRRSRVRVSQVAELIGFKPERGSTPPLFSMRGRSRYSNQISIS